MSEWTAEEDAELAKLRMSGLSFGDIARKMGKSRNACCSRADRAGLKKIAPVSRPRPRDALTREHDIRDLNFLDDVAEGVPVRVAGRKHGISTGHAQRMVKEYWTGEPI